MAWGGHANGKIPSSALSPVSAQLGPFLRSDAAASVKLLQLAFMAHFGIPLVIVEAYRDLLRQEYLFDGWSRRLPGFNLAMTPGYSNHGWAIACDFGSGVNVFGSEHKLWMDANAPFFGWKPSGNAFSPREAWHFEFVATPVITTIAQVSQRYAAGAPLSESLEDDMTAQDVAEIKAVLNNIQSLIATEPGTNVRALINKLQATTTNVESILAKEAVNGVSGGIRAMVVQAVAESRNTHATVSNVESIVAVDTFDGVKGGIRGRLSAIAKAVSSPTAGGSTITTATDAELVAELTRRMKG